MHHWPLANTKEKGKNERASLVRGTLVTEVGTSSKMNRSAIAMVASYARWAKSPYECLVQDFQIRLCRRYSSCSKGSFLGLVQRKMYMFLLMNHTYSLKDIANFPNRHTHTHDRPADSQCCSLNLIIRNTHDTKIKEGRVGAVQSTETRGLPARIFISEVVQSWEETLDRLPW